MRILYLINAPGPRLNGACRCTLLLARHAVERGCVVCIGAPQGSAIHAAGAAVGIPTAVMPMTYGPVSLRTLRREVRSFGPDIVHAMSFVPLTLAGLPRRDARDLPKSFVSILVDPASPLPMARVRFRSLVMRFRNAVARRHARDVDTVFAVSNAVKQRLGDLGIQGNIVVAQDAVDIDDLRKRASMPMPLPGGRPRIGTACAQIVVGKGVGDLVEAFSRIARAYPEASLVIAGEPDSSLDVPALASKFGVANRVHLTGFLEDTAPFFPGLDLYVMASHSEGLNTSILEASALGVPVVGTNVGGIPEAIVAGETGLLAEARDPAALADAMLAMLGDSQRAGEMAARAEARAAAAFDTSRLFSIIDSEYDRALAKVDPSRARASTSDKLTRGSLLITATQVVTVAVAYATNVFLARRLGPDAFGLFGVIVTVMMWLEMFVAEGLPLWVARTTDSVADLRHAVPRHYVLAQLALSVALVAALVLSAPTLARVFGAPNSTGLFRLASVDIPIYAGYALLIGVLIGARLYRAQSASLIAYQLAKLIATVTLVGTAGLAVVGAVLGSVTASVVGLGTSAASVFAHSRRLGPATGPGSAAAAPPRADGAEEAADRAAMIAAGAGQPQTPMSSASDVLGGSAASAAFVLLQTLLLAAGLWLLRAMVPGDEAGYFRAASLVGQVPIELSAGFTWALYAAYAAAFRAGDTIRCRHYLSQATRLVVTCGVAWVAIVAPTATDVTALLFSARYQAGGPPLAALSVGLGVGLLGMVLGPTFLIRERKALLIGVSAALVVVEIVLVAVLAPRFGAFGAAIASAVSLALGGVMLLAFVTPELDFKLVPLLVRTLVPGAIVGLVAGLVPMPGPTWLILWYPALAALFAALLWASGAVTRADLQAVREGLS